MCEYAYLALPAVFITLGLVYSMVMYRRAKSAGGAGAARYWREQFGLAADENVVAMTNGCFYLGPLVPSTQRDLVQKAGDLLSGTRWRGANLFFAFTDRERFAVAVEATEDGPKAVQNTQGLVDIGYAVLGVYGPVGRPQVLRAIDAWPGSKDLPKKKDHPKIRTLSGETTRLDLVCLMPNHQPSLVFFIDPQWVRPLQDWCGGGPVLQDPKWDTTRD